jgi:hypothetical protein
MAITTASNESALGGSSCGPRPAREPSWLSAPSRKVGSTPRPWVGRGVNQSAPQVGAPRGAPTQSLEPNPAAPPGLGIGPSDPPGIAREEVRDSPRGIHRTHGRWFAGRRRSDGPPYVPDEPGSASGSRSRGRAKFGVLLDRPAPRVRKFRVIDPLFTYPVLEGFQKPTVKCEPWR